MGSQVARFVAVALALAVGQGCLLEDAPSRVEPPGAAPRPAGTSRPAASPSPRRSPTPAPSVKPSPTPAPSVSYMLRPVALNPPGTVGFTADTRTFAALSVATDRPAPLLSLGAGATDAAAYRTPPRHVAATVDGDAHVAFRRWERDMLAGLRPAQASPRRVAQSTQAPAERSFWVITQFEPETLKDVRVTARRLVSGKECHVYVDVDALGTPAELALAQTRAEGIVAAYDEKIHPTNTRLFGAVPNPGIDNDPRVVILVSPAVGNYGKDTTLGFFSQRDAFVPSVNSAPVLQHSNQGEILYLSSRLMLSGSTQDALGTLAHELQHMINFHQKVTVGGAKESEALWVDEGMAMYAIEANGYGLKQGGEVLSRHVKRFMQSPDQFSLTDWAKNPEGTGYGPVYLFMTYMADRFGEAFLKELVQSRGIGSANVDARLALRGSSLNSLFHDWALANLVGSLPDAGPGPEPYRSIAIKGENGATRLPGFSTATLALPATESVSPRPYTVRYYELPRGGGSPRFSLSPDGLVLPRLVLPE